MKKARSFSNKSNSIIRVFTPEYMSNRFGVKDPVISRLLGEDTSKGSQFDETLIDDLKELIPKLPKKEQDLIKLYYFDKKRQKDIAYILSLSQGGVSLRLKKAEERLHYLMNMPILDLDIFNKDMVSLKISEDEIDIMIKIYQTTSLTATAKLRERDTQCRVRHRFLKCLKIYEDVVNTSKDMVSPFSLDKDLVDRCARYYTMFMNIKKHFNILNERELAQWAHKSLNTLFIEDPS